MDEHVENFLKSVQDLREEKGVGPADVMPFLYILGQLKWSIKRLEAEGKLKLGDTMNDKYVKLL